MFIFISKHIFYWCSTLATDLILIDAEKITSFLLQNIKLYFLKQNDSHTQSKWKFHLNWIFTMSTLNNSILQKISFLISPDSKILHNSSRFCELLFIDIHFTDHFHSGNQCMYINVFNFVSINKSPQFYKC